MSKALLAIGFVSMLWGNLALAAYQDEVLADNPVAYYRFEETSGTTAFDTTANSNDGTYTNGVLINQSGAASLGKPRDLMASTITSARHARFQQASRWSSGSTPHQAV